MLFSRLANQRRAPLAALYLVVEFAATFGAAAILQGQHKLRAGSRFHIKLGGVFGRAALRIAQV
jgi:hypothetical protein